MKHIKMYEEWSPKFNRTLQGAAALATSTNKGFGKASKSIEEYANRSISKEEFKLESEQGEIFTITHDPKFILKPVETFKNFNSDFKKQSYSCNIPALLKVATRRSVGSHNSNLTICFLNIGSDSNKTVSIVIEQKTDGVSENVGRFRFSDRASIENFLAMAVQSILSSPENMNNDKELDPSKPGDTFEKQHFLDIIQNVILSRDMREFTM